MIHYPFLLCLAGLITIGAPCSAFDETELEKPLAKLFRQLKDARKTGKLPAGFRLHVQANLSRPADENGPEKTHQESWEFTAKKVYRLENKNRGGKRIWVRREGRDYDKKRLAEVILESNPQTIGSTDEEGPVTLFAGTDYLTGDRSIDLIVDEECILSLGECCAFAAYGPKDAERFAQLYENLIKLTCKKADTSPKQRSAK